MGTYTDLQELSKSDPDEVMRQCYGLLDKNPDDALALFLMGQIMAECERYGYAANLFQRVCAIKPEKAECWNNLGMCLDGLDRHQEALKMFRKAWDMEKRPRYASNIGNAYLGLQRYQEAEEWARRSISLESDNKPARSVLGMAFLSQGKWAEGWDNYESLLGGKFRKETQYQEEGRWDGSPGKTLIVYGEQGLGDEVMYASCIPDVARDNKVVLECDPRLEGLFRRSFPNVDVYGTRREAADWLDKYQFDGRCSVGTLPKHFRRSREEFPGTPYLTADPERVTQWKAIFNRPTIGICWSGGSKHNKRDHRAIGLEAFRPLIEAMPDCDFVSLQYKDPTGEIEASGLPVRHFKRATQTEDYDDTAGLVGALDLVVGVHTSVHHLAGALGVPGLILVPDQTLWLYANEFPWYASASLFRQKHGEAWSQTIKRLVPNVKDHPSLCRV